MKIQSIDPLELLVFVHIPKTGGVSFNKVLVHVYGHSHLFHALPEDLLKNLSSLNEKQKNKIYVVTAHHGSNLTNKFFPTRQIRLVTLLRNPADRIISLLKYIRQTQTHRHYKSLANKTLDQAFDYLSANDINVVSDLQCRFICGKPSFEEAKLYIEKNYSVVGTTDFFINFVKECCSKFKWEIQEIDLNKKHNISKNQYKEAPSQELLEKIKSINKEDTNLYNYWFYNNYKGFYSLDN